MEPFNIGTFPVILLWWYTLSPARTQYQDMVCEGLGSRHARKMTEPGPECDMSDRNWCTVKTTSYPEERIMEIILDNRGIMKRLFGDHREARLLEYEFTNTIDDPLERPLPSLGAKRRKNPRAPKEMPQELINGKYRDTEILANPRNDSQDDGLERFVTESSQFEEDSTTPTEEPEWSTVSRENSTTNQSLEASANVPKQESSDLIPKVTDSPSSTLALDSGDELSYMDKTSNGSRITTQPPSPTTVKNSLRSETLNNADEEETKTSDDFLEGRVEIQTRYKQPPIKRPNLGQRRKPSFSGQFHNRGRPSSSSSSTYTYGARPSASPNERKPPGHSSASYNRKPPASHSQSPHYERIPPLRERTELPPPQSSFTSQKRTEKPNVYRPPFPTEKFPACNSTSELIAPTWAKNIQGKNLIVVNVGSFMQHLHVEECDKEALYRKMYCQRGCRCEQQYRLQKLLVIDPDDECRGIFSDWFRFPSCCVCVCYPASLQSIGSSRNARIIDEDYVDYEDEDFYEEEDLDDPEVRFYYGLDKELEEDEEDDVWGDLEAQPSSQHVYKSFTDIESIDRSFTEEFSPYSSSESSKDQTPLPANTNFIRKPVIWRPMSGHPVQNTSDDFDLTAKKSRLLKGFNRTVNIRPQIPPRRFPPPRRSSFPWLNSPSISVWPSLAIYRHIVSANNPKKNQGVANSLNGFGVTPSSGKVFDSTLGTLNAATPPFYNWHRRSSLSEHQTLGKGRDKKSLLSRIPRGAERTG